MLDCSTSSARQSSLPVGELHNPPGPVSGWMDRSVWGLVVHVVERYRRASAIFGEHVHAIAPDQWGQPTPCSEWDVRELVNHVVNENLWAPELLTGKTVADVGDRFDGDLLGDDPERAWDSSSAAALIAVAVPRAMDRTVHLSFGDFPGAEYTEQLIADLLVHGWDLARAIGRDETLDAELVDATAEWFGPWESGYRDAGAIGARAAVADDDPGARLLAAFGRDPRPTSPRDT